MKQIEKNLQSFNIGNMKNKAHNRSDWREIIKQQRLLKAPPTYGDEV